MPEWLRRIDRWLFSPPHTLGSVLCQVAVTIDPRLLAGPLHSAEQPAPKADEDVPAEGGKPERTK
jgi:hypothetical protein